MIFRRSKPPECEESFDAEIWARLLLTSQSNALSLAQAMLLVVDNPDLFTYAMRQELEMLIQELRDGVARFEEYVV